MHRMTGRLHSGCYPFRSNDYASSLFDVRHSFSAAVPSTFPALASAFWSRDHQGLPLQSVIVARTARLTRRFWRTSGFAYSRPDWFPVNQSGSRTLPLRHWPPNPNFSIPSTERQGRGSQRHPRIWTHPDGFVARSTLPDSRAIEASISCGCFQPAEPPEFHEPQCLHSVWTFEFSIHANVEQRTWWVEPTLSGGWTEVHATIRKD